MLLYCVWQLLVHTSPILEKRLAANAQYLYSVMCCSSVKSVSLPSYVASTNTTALLHEVALAFYSLACQLKKIFV